MMFKKISLMFVKSPLNFCLISQILVHSLWHVCLNSVLNWSVDPLTLSVNNGGKR